MFSFESNINFGIVVHGVKIHGQNSCFPFGKDTGTTVLLFFIINEVKFLFSFFSLFCLSLQKYHTVLIMLTL